MSQWDPDKAAENLRKHGVDFSDAVTVLVDDFALMIEIREFAEDRFAAIGLDRLGRLLAVVYTWRGADLRLISARRATRGERRNYEAARK